ncbi:hypothetical protein Aru02nite_52630 [Actinocatenispora rupis]|uniref:Uncharacterized protein n=1 Tax=Actinocatenispora rupis TaxID=519421 RepID=A0A8J3NCJ2_9ACTN|nr:hypothetical protein Aru02nite_52630 [Actinocatenispora rupis]
MAGTERTVRAPAASAGREIMPVPRTPYAGWQDAHQAARHGADERAGRWEAQ